MSIQKSSTRRIGDEHDVALNQCGALCYRFRKKKIQVLMITSRRTKRWIVPKGWLIDGMTGAESAAIEAWEEAGVTGKVSQDSIGLYSYVKEAERKGEVDRDCVTMVYPLRVKSLKNRYPERAQRRRKWMSLKKASRLVNEPELAALIRNFAPEQG